MTAPVDLYHPGTVPGPLLLTCDHASSRIPRPLRTTAADRPWLETHWARDLGAANVVRELARRTGSMAVLAAFSRLVCDANRPPDAADWIRRSVEGHRLSFNRGLDAQERGRRHVALYGPYHLAVARAVQASPSDTLLLAIHSFTPVYGGELRPMQAGVLFDNGNERLAQRLARLLRQTGLTVALNRPYSGKRGMIYAAQRAGRHGQLPYLELEIRQDQLRTPAQARAFARRVLPPLLELLPGRRRQPGQAVRSAHG